MERFECNCAIDLWLESRGVVKLTKMFQSLLLINSIYAY